MKEGSEGFVRADQIDLKSIDEQLERHMNKALTVEKNKRKEEDDFAARIVISPRAIKPKGGLTFRKQRHDWEIDPSKLIIKSVIARGTFGIVHRGVYDGQDAAGQSHIHFRPSPSLFGDDF